MDNEFDFTNESIFDISIDLLRLERRLNNKEAQFLRKVIEIVNKQAFPLNCVVKFEIKNQMISPIFKKGSLIQGYDIKNSNLLFENLEDFFNYLLENELDNLKISFSPLNYLEESSKPLDSTKNKITCIGFGFFEYEDKEVIIFLGVFNRKFVSLIGHSNLNSWLFFNSIYNDYRGDEIED